MKLRGMDVQTWLTEGLVDILSVAYSTEHMPPMQELIELAHQHGVPVYPICNSFHKTEVDEDYKHEGMLGNLPVWRGEALNIRAQGADGSSRLKVAPGCRSVRCLGCTVRPLSSSCGGSSQ